MFGTPPVESCFHGEANGTTRLLLSQDFGKASPASSARPDEPRRAGGERVSEMKVTSCAEVVAKITGSSVEDELAVRRRRAG